MYHAPCCWGYKQPFGLRKLQARPTKATWRLLGRLAAPGQRRTLGL